MDELDPIEEYLKRQAEYSAFCTNVGGLLKELLVVLSLQVVLFETRLKDVGSLRRKLEEYAKNIDSLDEIGDLVGLRAVFLHRSQLELAEQRVKEEFKVHKGITHDYKSGSIGQFGYRSLHLVVSVNAARSKLSEWNRFKGFRAEIQLRTVLQHAWAAHSHGLDYKPGTVGLDEQLQRDLAVLSADLEGAEKQFQSLREKSADLDIEYNRCIEEGCLDEVKLTVRSIRAYSVVLRPRLEELRIFAKELKYDSDTDGNGWPASIIQLRLGSMEEFVAIAIHCGFKTLADVERVVQSVENHKSEFVLLRTRCAELDFCPAPYPFDLMTLALAFDHLKARKKLAGSRYFAPKLRKALVVPPQA